MVDGGYGYGYGYTTDADNATGLAAAATTSAVVSDEETVEEISVYSCAACPCARLATPGALSPRGEAIFSVYRHVPSPVVAAEV